jgi:hypothetical protein
VPPNPGIFISDQDNACKKNETRDSCFMRYTVKRNSASGGSSQYTLVNSNLQCPTGYYIVAALDNKLVDESNPNDVIHYYDEKNIFPVTKAQYDLFSTTDFVCSIPTPVDDQKTVSSGERCTNDECGGPVSQYKTINGFVTEKVSKEFHQDTYNWGVEKCKHYTLSGCPAWCSRWKWESYKYKQVACKREAGFYKMPSTPSADLIASASSLYTPSVVICSKPSVGWNQN